MTSHSKTVVRSPRKSAKKASKSASKRSRSQKRSNSAKRSRSSKRAHSSKRSHSSKKSPKFIKPECPKKKMGRSYKVRNAPENQRVTTVSTSPVMVSCVKKKAALHRLQSPYLPTDISPQSVDDGPIMCKFRTKPFVF